MDRRLPSGTVTLLFTDVESSTKLLHELGAAHYANALADHRQTVRRACTKYGGIEVDTQGDAFFIAFPTATGALEAAREARDALANGRIRVRMGLHTGSPYLTEEGYVGEDVHKGARIAAVGHGGQILLSHETRRLVETAVTELGEHRLKDFNAPVVLFQLGTQRFPPLKTISNTNLPRPASSFIGRNAEVQEIASLLRDSARLLTLTGSGGSGKTRLAIEAATELVSEFKAGVFWIGLAGIRDPTLVFETIGNALGAGESLEDHIAEREMLLLLDNFEQVIEAAGQLASLVEACPNLKVIVTSREVLRVRGELGYPVEPLAHPDAVALFCARAATDPSTELHELCRALDNLPLAVELAAARVRILSPTQILERITERLDLLKGGRDADPRQQTLRAALEWSHDLLRPEERRLFARLGVFRDGCTLDAAEDVVEADVDLLQSLVDKSLLRHTEERFWMLETIRDYAAEQLDVSDESASVYGRHAEFFAAMAEDAYPNLRGTPKEWVEVLESEHDNLRAALDWLQTSGNRERALQLAGALAPFWYLRDHFAEGRRRLEMLLDTTDSRTAARARALTGAAALEGHIGNIVGSRRYAEAALELSEEQGDARGIAHARFTLAHAATDAGDLTRSRDEFEDCVGRFRELGDDHFTLLAARNLADLCERLGDRERARSLHEDNLHRARSVGNERIVAMALGRLGAFAAQEGRGEDAVPMLQECLRIHQGIGDLFDVAADLIVFAAALAAKAESANAARFLSAAEAIHEEIGTPMRPWLAEEYDLTLAAVRATLDDGTFARACEQGHALTADEAVAAALTC